MDHKIAVKVHSNFAHPNSERLIRLLNSADEKWSKKNKKLKEEIKKVTKNCDICRRYKKAPPRPFVGFPMATKFYECVEMISNSMTVK